MYIAMNKFRIQPGRQDEFIKVWKERDSGLDSVPGFQEFHLLQGPVTDEAVVFVSHSVWDSAEAFENWTKSEAFRKAHASAGGSKDLYLGPPQFEGYLAVL